MQGIVFGKSISNVIISLFFNRSFFFFFPFLILIHASKNGIYLAEPAQACIPHPYPRK